MADANTNSNGTPPAAGGTPPAAADPGATTTPPAGTPPAATNTDTFDPSKLSPDQLSKVLENQDLWRNPRLAALLESDKQLKKLQQDQAAAADKNLEDNKKFEELATKRATDLATANQTIQNMKTDQALTGKLVKEQVVDLDGALKLIDRSKIAVDDNGTITGVDEALASLKTERPYLFTAGGNQQPQVGNPSNPQAPSAGASGQFKFKESQLTSEFYNAHKAEIDEAGRLGLIEADGPPPQR